MVQSNLAKDEAFGSIADTVVASAIICNLPSDNKLRKSNYKKMLRESSYKKMVLYPPLL